MNIALKSAITGALVLAAASANALGTPALNNSDLVLIVQDQITNATYALDTGITINSVFGAGAGTYVSGANLSTAFTGLNQTIANSSTLQTFLNTSDPIGFTIEGAQYNGGTPTTNATTNNIKNAGSGLGIFSSFIGTITPSNIAGIQTGNFVTFLNGVNNDTMSTTGLANLTGTESTTVGYSADASTKYGLIGVNDLQALGTTDSLFGLTGNNQKNGPIQSYLLGTASLTKSGLTFAANGGGTTPPPVPLPAAVWLFGSGLLGLVGVSRRRKTSV